MCRTGGSGMDTNVFILVLGIVIHRVSKRMKVNGNTRIQCGSAHFHRLRAPFYLLWGVVFIATFYIPVVFKSEKGPQSYMHDFWSHLTI